jgi:hypothetical protein
MLSKRRTIGAPAAALAALGLLGVLGCDRVGPKTYPVRGKVELVSGDVRELAGSHVEAALAGDPAVRSSGEIQPDGSFSLQTLHAGVILRGAPEGDYQVRIILADEGGGRRRRPLDHRLLQFGTSGLSFRVPASGDLTLRLAQR